MRISGGLWVSWDGVESSWIHFGVSVGTLGRFIWGLVRVRRGRVYVCVLNSMCMWVQCDGILKHSNTLDALETYILLVAERMWFVFVVLSRRSDFNLDSAQTIPIVRYLLRPSRLQSN